MKNIILTAFFTGIFISAMNSFSTDTKVLIIGIAVWFMCSYFLDIFIMLKDEADSRHYSNEFYAANYKTPTFLKILLFSISPMLAPVAWLADREIACKAMAYILDVEKFELRSPIKAFELQNPFVIEKKAQ